MFILGNLQGQGDREREGRGEGAPPPPPFPWAKTFFHEKLENIKIWMWITCKT